MQKIAEEVIEEVSRRVLQDFRNDYIQKYVYGWGKPRTYKRTFEFMDAWEWTPIKRDATSIVKKMFYNPEKVSTFDPDAFGGIGGVNIGYHGSLETRQTWDEDARPYLDEILDKNRSELKSKWNGNTVTPPRTGEYWGMFISQYVEGGKLRSLINTVAKSKGLTIK